VAPIVGAGFIAVTNVGGEHAAAACGKTIAAAIQKTFPALPNST